MLRYELLKYKYCSIRERSSHVVSLQTWPSSSLDGWAGLALLQPSKWAARLNEPTVKTRNQPFQWPMRPTLTLGHFTSPIATVRSNTCQILKYLAIWKSYCPLALLQPSKWAARLNDPTVKITRNHPFQWSVCQTLTLGHFNSPILTVRSSTWQILKYLAIWKFAL